MLLSESEKNSLLERFLKYVKVWTTSDSQSADQNIQPSTQRQFDLANILKDELNQLGLQDVQITEKCYVYGFLPASTGMETKPAFALLAHMDTVEEVSGENVNPQIVKKYSGQVIELNCGVRLDPATDAALAEAAKNGETIIHTDGTTLLGADDKAGVAAIMEALVYFKNHPETKHSAIEVIFSPDEETGHGMDNVPLNLLKSKHAYTVDGGHIGELEIECFNAFKSEIFFEGVSTHTGTARGKLVNAVTMASSFVSNLPKHLSPETTDGYQGFISPMSVEGTLESAKVNLILRDFTKPGMEEKKSLVDSIAQTTAKIFGGKVKVIHTQQYINMKEGFDKNPEVVENLIKAYKKAGVEPVFTPIRGGTDGSRLTEMGIPTPNIFTGGHNYHSRNEWCSLEQMCSACEILINLGSN
ncbi:MAG: peptidase T [Treponema sp.]|nr:peptidase T [Candidatus Treponema equifaecale]